MTAADAVKTEQCFLTLNVIYAANRNTSARLKL